jgi:polysaccharide biosynthesis transport protein
MSERFPRGTPLAWVESPEPPSPVTPTVPPAYGGHSASVFAGSFYADVPESGGIRGDFLMDRVRTIYKRRWIALTTFAILFLGVAIRTFSTTPIYEGCVQLLIDSANPNVMKFQEVNQSSFLFEQSFYQTQITILRSRRLARRTIEATKLWGSPDLSGAAWQGSFGPANAARAVSGWVVGLLSSSKSESRAPAAAETERQSLVIDAFLKALTVSPVRNSSLADIRFASPDPATAAVVANALARQYIDQNLEYKFLSTKEASDWLASQLAVERKKLEDSEQALQKYRETGDAVALEDRQNIVVQRLADLNAAYTQARIDRFEKKALYHQLIDLRNNHRDLDTFPAILSNPFIQQLKTQLADLQRQRTQMAERLGERHPDMIRLTLAIDSTETKLQDELGTVVHSVRNEYLSAETKERGLAAELETQKVGALSLNQKGIQYGVLRREAESNKQMYEALLRRAKETEMSGELRASNIRVVDEAELPRKPVRPRKAQALLLGLIGGLVSGLGLAFFVERLDNRVKSPDDIQQFLGLAFLGLVPSVRDRELVGGRSPLISETVAQDFAEAFREIRTNVVFSSADEGPRSVLVTSTQPSEGKSVVSVNLAVSLARSGLRVLLLDADMHKPRLHDLTGVQQEPGLSNLLVGRAKPGDVVWKTSTANLWVIPAGPIPPDAAELLGSTRFMDLLRTFGHHFEWVVIDSPPVMAVTDPAVVANRSTDVLFVIGSEQVSRRRALTAVQKLQAAHGKILGAVLNRASVRRNPYYYSDYYAHEYTGYYPPEQRPT